MTGRDAHSLAARVRREAGTKVSVTIGQTNGRTCVHVNILDPKDASRSSFTYYSEGEWAISPLNRANRPTKAAQARSGQEGGAEGLGSVIPPDNSYDPLDEDSQSLLRGT